ncbi:MAG: ABC transporter permease [Oscillospiraceae bacterium]|nr:ABC transporter permease [Oscillospiraceae bacterium]MBP5168512.1 ABC transporter permease [Oscillospiraceae bacterium]
MKFRQSVKMAISAVFSNKMRSFLTMLGIIIGVLSVTLLISIVQSGTGTITDAMSTLGGDQVTVSITEGEKRLLYFELDELKANEAVNTIAPYMSGKGVAKAGGKSKDVTVYGVTKEYDAINNLTLTGGRFLSELDREYRLNVCVLGAEVAEELFGRESALDRTVRIQGKDFRVIGVLEEEDEYAMNSTNRRVFIPLTTAQRIFKQTGITNFILTADNKAALRTAQTAVADFLDNKFSEDSDYTIINMAEILDIMGTVMNTLSLMLGGIAGISLLVGGIGIMNIMLVSVTERTREIGIRKAIGAQRSDITIQFMIESIFISLMGGVIGMLLSIVTLKVLNHFVTEVTFVISPSVAMLALSFSIAVGLIFGIYPASKAAKLSPINALRYE